MSRATVCFVVFLSIASTVFPVPGRSEDRWPRFRGPNGAGVSTETGFPASWGPDQLVWDVALPGEGHSSPIVWEDRVFVTSAEDEGRVRYVLCLDARDGSRLWTRTIAMEPSHKHLRNSWASSTPATDGQRVYATAADEAKFLVLAYDFEGNLVWQRNLGRFESQHNLGASPIVYKDLVVVTNDQMGPSFVTALDAATGRTRWLTKRPSRRTSYATPLIFRGPDGQDQLICVSDATGVTSLDPETGELNWSTPDFPLRTVASPVVADGLVIASCGQGGRFGVLQVAVDPSLKFDGTGQQRIRWKRTKIIPYVPTPIYYHGYLFEWTDQGLVACVDPQTGQDIWRKRVGGNFSSSPVCVDGKIYAVSDEGDVIVIAADTTFRLLGRTSLDDLCRATPAVSNGRLFIRTAHRLMCVQDRKTRQ